MYTAKDLSCWWGSENVFISLHQQKKPMSSYFVTIDEHSHRGKLVLQLLTELMDKRKVNVLSLEEFETKSDAILAKEIRKGMKTSTLSYEEGKKEFARLRQSMNK